jgi:CBS domain containing-hemolysin-like protein
MDPTIAIPLALLLLAGNAFFVGAEFSLVSARRSSIETLANQGSKPARLALKAMENLSLTLAGAQLGITLCSLGLGALGEPLVAHMLEGPFHDLHLPEQLIHPISFAIALTIMTYLHVVLGEMVPKNLALTDPDRSALFLARPMLFAIKVLHPAVLALSAIASSILRLFGVKPQDEVVSTFTRDEVAGFVEESHREGLLTTDEEQLLAGALRFDEASVKRLALPLSQLVTVPSAVTPAEIEQLSAATGFSRFPVRTRRGRLSGYIHLKDVLHADVTSAHVPLTAKEIRPLIDVKATQSLRQALTLMRRQGAHLARVIGPRGSLLGIVTMEDVLEQLVGEISEYQAPRQGAQAKKV